MGKRRCNTDDRTKMAAGAAVGSSNCRAGSERQPHVGAGLLLTPPPSVHPSAGAARSHGNSAASEQLVFVFFGSRGAAGPLPDAGGVRWAEPLPDARTSAGTDSSVFLGIARKLNHRPRFSASSPHPSLVGELLTLFSWVVVRIPDVHMWVPS